MVTTALWVAVGLIAVALIFDFTNGFHDAANSIATVVATKTLTPFQAVAMAAFYLKGVSPPYVTLNQIFSGMLPFMGIQIIAIVMLYLLPEIGLWLPQTLYGR